MNKFLYWLISLTWGLPMTLVGLVVSLALLITGHKPKRFGLTFYFEFGEGSNGWTSGCEFGPIFVANKNSPLSLKQHEHGHGLQNLMFGPLMLILTPCSIARYWYREYLVRSGKKKYNELPPYDSWWFEGQATRLGQKYFKEG